MSPLGSTKHRCATALAAVLVAAFVQAQQTYPRPSPTGQSPQDPASQNPWQQPGAQQPGAQQPGTQRPGDPNMSREKTYYGDSLRNRWGQVPPDQGFQGWPAFPNQLSGYGAYPRDAMRAAGVPVPLPLAPSPPEPEGWPSWMRASGKEPLPYAPELALLVRLGDRVWMRTADDEPFVPMFFHDKMRALRTGARVEVRQVGEFGLLLHRSTRIISRGPASIDLGKMDAKEVHLRMPAFTWVRLAASERLHKIELPDGSTLEIPPPPAAAAAAPPMLLPLSIFGGADPLPGITEIMFVRADEPGWLGGRATIANLGGTDVVWHHATGELTLHPDERVTFFLRRPPHPLPAALTTEGVEAEIGDTVATCRAQQGGSATWSGALFRLPAGASVRFDAQQGRPFARRAQPQ